MAAGPSQHGGGSRPGSSEKTPERTCTSQVRPKSTGSVRTGPGQSPVLRTSDRSRTPNRARTPIRHQTPDREATPDRGKAHASQASPSSPPDCQMMEPFPPPPSRAASTRDPRTASGGQNPEHHTGSDPECPKGEYNFWNTRFPDTTCGRSRGLRGRDCPFPEHEEDAHATVEGVAGRRLIRRQRPRQPFEGGSGSEETPYQPKVPTLEFVLVRVVVCN